MTSLPTKSESARPPLPVPRKEARSSQHRATARPSCTRRVSKRLSRSTREWANFSRRRTRCQSLQDHSVATQLGEGCCSPSEKWSSQAMYVATKIFASTSTRKRPALLQSSCCRPCATMSATAPQLPVPIPERRCPQACWILQGYLSLPHQRARPAFREAVIIGA